MPFLGMTRALGMTAVAIALGVECDVPPRMHGRKASEHALTHQNSLAPGVDRPLAATHVRQLVQAAEPTGGRSTASDEMRMAILDEREIRDGSSRVDDARRAGAVDVTLTPARRSL
jgi:hypothetical protein